MTEYDRGLLIEVLRQVYQACRVVLERFEPVKSVDDFAGSPAGMEKLDAICMQLIGIGESLKKIDTMTQGQLLEKYPTVDQNGLNGHFIKNRSVRSTPVPKNLSIVQAKTHLSDCVREVEQGGSVLITRHGKAVAALVPAEILEHVERLKKAGPLGGLASIAGGWKGSEELVRLLAQPKRSTKPRKQPVLD